MPWLCPIQSLEAARLLRSEGELTATGFAIVPTTGMCSQLRRPEPPARIAFERPSPATRIGLASLLVPTSRRPLVRIGDWLLLVADLPVAMIACDNGAGPLSFFAVGTLADGSLAQCRAGHYRDGESHARQAYESSVKAFGPRAGLTGGAAYSLASCLIGLDKLDEATTLLRQIDAPAVAQLAGDPNWGAGVTLAQAEIAYRRHNYNAARADVQTVAPVFARKDAEPYQKRAFESLKAALNQPSSQS
jgi:hypothetical protein